ncbi:NAD(P)-dependent oxidoreductase [Amycolatopsis sp. NPDC059027]|uniref:NAD(P)-dependent oxidoreductase n=1 Tax=Amycolatopsis sp. NPDC059027 TaxID=3346709 RepID=UPI003671F2E7
MADVVRILVSNETDDQIGHELFSRLEGVELITYDPANPTLSDQQRQAEILMAPYRGTHRAKPYLQQLPALRMVQLPAAGTDEWLDDVPKHLLLAGSRGGHSRPVAEWVLSAILTQLRQWPALVRSQDESVWAHRKFEMDTLAGKRVLIIGAGGIGTAVSRMLAPFDADSTLVASRARGDVHGSDELPSLIGGHQIVVITAPLNDATFRLVDRDFLAAMDDGALLVNVGRGKIVDTDALVGELRSGRLRAALDVTDPEPLPADHPIWSCQGAIISPHSARTVPGTSALVYAVAAEQIAAFLDGREPTNAVIRR